ncbi:DUF2274 domain-containing protein [Sphingopyxis macrogoltabida]|uniref:DUF2274 domain-containing protein n=1 Tax=Sphingopyxis macrogoltabida TaxID=33050 RepID=A0A0N9U4H6_SPHMC|nr:DUF2274 domain-containing protein [Sphingopyxis macrogoltabida]ALH79993.1 hypothetical protein AN936_06315 [Sphingopyxis macrogoltabida]
MTGLRLGAIAEEKPVRLTIELTGHAHRELVDYARVHARLNSLSEPLSPEKLVGPMIARFIASDRVFARERRRD